jgi:hypothetical protein
MVKTVLFKRSGANKHTCSAAYCIGRGGKREEVTNSIATMDDPPLSWATLKSHAA